MPSAYKSADAIQFAAAPVDNFERAFVTAFALTATCCQNGQRCFAADLHSAADSVAAASLQHADSSFQYFDCDYRFHGFDFPALAAWPFHLAEHFRFAAAIHFAHAEFDFQLAAALASVGRSSVTESCVVSFDLSRALRCVQNAVY